MSGLTSQTAYSQFITYQLAVAIGVIDKNLEYDTAWGEAGRLYVDFCDSQFDDPSMSEYDAIVKYLENEKLTQDLAKAEAERKSKKGNHTVKVEVTRNYYKAVEVEVVVPRSMTKEEREDYIFNSLNVNNKIEDAISEASLNWNADDKWDYSIQE